MTELSIEGTFEVQLCPIPLSDVAANSGMGRMSIEKTYSGALVGVSIGEMLSYRSPEPTSAGYVALEVFTGTLNGKRGSFALQHSSMLTLGVPSQAIGVVSGSGTEELQGLKGNLTIENSSGQHHYHFTFSLPTV